MEKESGDETHKEDDNDVLDSDDMETPKEGGDVLSTSTSKKATTP